MIKEMESDNRKISILFIPLYDKLWASSRYRVYNYVPILREKKIICKVVVPPSKNISERLRYMIQIFINLRKSHVVFIQKKIFKRSIFFLIHKTNPNIIFDFDDALFAKPSSISQKNYNSFKAKKNFHYTLKKSKAVITGNLFLKEYATQYNKNVHVIPTPVEMIKSQNINELNEKTKITVGWIGRSGNLIYLKDLESVFVHINNQFGDKFVLKIICDEPLYFKNINIVNVQWSLESEAKEISDIDIGLMPLRDDEWSHGICAFKMLQFMSYGIPVVASPVGMNKEIIQDGFNGFLAFTQDEWFSKISSLIYNKNLRDTLGKEGKILVQKHFTYENTTAILIEILKSVAIKQNKHIGDNLK